MCSKEEENISLTKFQLRTELVDKLKKTIAELKNVKGSRFSCTFPSIFDRPEAKIIIKEAYSVFPQLKLCGFLSLFTPEDALQTFSVWWLIQFVNPTETTQKLASLYWDSEMIQQ